jgi:hypothetical protein
MKNLGAAAGSTKATTNSSQAARKKSDFIIILYVAKSRYMQTEVRTRTGRKEKVRAGVRAAGGLMRW